MKRRISEAERERRREIWKNVLLATLGAGICVGSFFLYYTIDHVIATVAICILDAGYAYFNASQLFDSQEWKGTKIVLIPILMFIFWAIVFLRALRWQRGTDWRGFFL